MAGEVVPGCIVGSSEAAGDGEQGVQAKGETSKRHPEVKCIYAQYIGPSTEHSSTPILSSFADDITPSMCTDCDCDVKERQEDNLLVVHGQHDIIMDHGKGCMLYADWSSFFKRCWVSQ